MIAEFLAWRIIEKKLTYSQVPLSLKDKVKSILIDAGCSDLIVE